MVFEYDSNDEWIDMDISEIEKSLSYESSWGFYGIDNFLLTKT
jgi:hypothetical protein